MFDIGGYELIVIAAVAILVVGPRELPGMLRSVGRFVTQARQMMAGVQRQFNDALKEAELDDVKKTIDDVRSLNPATKIRQTIAKEIKPFAEAGDSVKKAVGEVNVKGPTSAATAAATAASASKAEAAPSPGSDDAPAEAAPAPQQPAASTSTGSTLTQSKPRNVTPAVASEAPTAGAAPSNTSDTDGG